ncbi:hypothetical protein FEM03_21320 [Phragmitibacter flavus]|uniref:DUF4412 domain-containing protein n=1 Tax=Phragmitibacter flavus TaxID=2576071 RepID=A0A5R8K9Z2_9BACT|nr:hypothetical protein [Phragmitibacter flavus]TLD68725.1 hypothetical protein FEM03_21320 [Phragmitibacter flavus]
MKVALSLVFILSTSAFAQVAELKLDELRVKKDFGGETVYTNATLTKVDPDGLRFVHDSGTVKVPFEKLPTEIQQRFAFDSEAAAKHRKEMAAAAMKEEEEVKRIRQAENDRIQANKDHQAKLAKSVTMLVRVISVDKKGVIAEQMGPGRPVASSMAAVGGGGGVGSGGLAPSGPPMYLFGNLPVGLFDDAMFRVQATPDGTFSYTTVLGSKSTVKSFEVLNYEGQKKNRTP